jgi:hypothetical protein
MKKQNQSFKQLLMLPPMAIMLLSSSVYAQDFLSEKQIAEGVFIEEVEVRKEKVVPIKLKSAPIKLMGKTDIEHTLIETRKIEPVKNIMNNPHLSKSEEVQKLQIQVKKKQDEVDKLALQIQEINLSNSETISDLEEVVSATEMEISTLQTQIIDLEIINAAIESEKLALQESATKLSTELETIKSKLAEAQAKIVKLEEKATTLEKEKLAIEKERLELEEENESLVTAMCEQEDRLQSLETQISQSASMPAIMQSMMMMQQQNMMFMMQMMNSMNFGPSMTSGYGGHDMHNAMMLQSMQNGMQNSLFQNSIYSMIGMQNNMRPTYQFAGDFNSGNTYSSQGYGQNINAEDTFSPKSLLGTNSPYAYNTVGNFGSIKGYKAPVRPVTKPLPIPTGVDAVTEAELADDLQRQDQDIVNAIKG